MDGWMVHCKSLDYGEIWKRCTVRVMIITNIYYWGLGRAGFLVFVVLRVRREIFCVRLTSGLPMVSPVLSRGKIHVPMRNKKAARRLSATARTARRPGARAPHTYTKARLQLTRFRHIDVSFCQRRS
jgi:hypothetical protein